MYPRLKELRESLGMTQEEFGKSLDIAKSTYNNYETGIRDPKSDFWVAVAKKYGVTVDYLMGHSDDPHQTSDGEKFSREEIGHIKKYRALDDYGKEAVDGVLDVEYRRCEEDRQARDAAIFMKNREKTEPAEESRPSLSLHRPYSAVAAAEGSGAFLLDDGHDEITVELNRYTQQADVILKVVGRSMEPAISDGDCVLVRRQPSVNIGEIGVFIIDGQGYLKESAPDKLLSLNPEVNDVTFGDQQIVECYGKFISVLDPDWIIEC